MFVTSRCKYTSNNNLGGINIFVLLGVVLNTTKPQSLPLVTPQKASFTAQPPPPPHFFYKNEIVDQKKKLKIC
jgi:hypothetical protein